MATHKDTKYSVNARLVDLNSRLTRLEAENQALRVHLAGHLEELVSNAARKIQDAHDNDFRELKNSIRIPVDGKDGAQGPQGEQGLRGDCLIPNSDEVAAALLTIRKRHADMLARILNEIELSGGHHNGTKQLEAEIRARIARTIQIGGL